MSSSDGCLCGVSWLVSRCLLLRPLDLDKIPNGAYAQSLRNSIMIAVPSLPIQAELNVVFQLSFLEREAGPRFISLASPSFPCLFSSPNSIDGPFIHINILGQEQCVEIIVSEHDLSQSRPDRPICNALLLRTLEFLLTRYE